MKNKKLITAIVASVIILVLVQVKLTLSGKGIENMEGILWGVGSGLLGVGISYIFQKNFYKKNPQLYKKKTIEQNDERNIIIKNKAEAKAGKILMFLNYILAMLMIIFFDKSSEATLLILINVLYLLCIVFLIDRYNKD